MRYSDTILKYFIQKALLQADIVYVKHLFSVAIFPFCLVISVRWKYPPTEGTVVMGLKKYDSPFYKMNGHCLTVVLDYIGSLTRIKTRIDYEKAD